MPDLFLSVLIVLLCARMCSCIVRKCVCVLCVLLQVARVNITVHLTMYTWNKYVPGQLTYTYISSECDYESNIPVVSVVWSSEELYVFTSPSLMAMLSSL